MPRRPAEDKEREYAELSAFINLWSTEVWKVDPASESHPAHVGPRIRARFGLTQALAGARQGVNDILEGVCDIPLEGIREIDAHLRNAGVLTLTELRRRYAARYKAILKRGALRNETDYYLVKGILDDADSPIDEEERDRLGRMLIAFEGAA
ncbi:hypothetical protein [Noviluteimonas gilva]|uniref:hypothetical protein n=1 Tax=Noviluteimonas gilva TaxID=2682097 RepID=UPI001E296C7F|nr:hypothetical protein [Lysobacter gilvus]